MRYSKALFKYILTEKRKGIFSNVRIFYILTHSHTNQRQKTETEKATESERVTTVRQRYRDRLI